ncbi:hypothetical protein LTR85_004149 [Meristemomyces frigidus]|nr:hypothetical protein LTR85_004149 [Meristemomyces frigidus]
MAKPSQSTESQSLALGSDSHAKDARLRKRARSPASEARSLPVTVGPSARKRRRRGPQQPDPSYTYRPLQDNQIRVFEIKRAANADDPITGRLLHAELENSQSSRRYITLSYAWGPTYPDGSHLTDTVMCEGQVIWITATLLEALKQIRRKVSVPVVVVWVDAICINQSDNSERAQQVRRMGEVYASSVGLVIWQGVLSQNSEEADALRQTLDLWKVPSTEYKLTYADNLKPTRHGIALDALLRRPWFGRRWVIQEYRLTPLGHARFLIGDIMIEASIIQSLLERNRLASNAHFGPFPRAMAHDGELLHELWYQRRAGCKDPHDVVYALLYVGFDASFVNIDYNVTAEQLYLSVAKHYVGLAQTNPAYIIKLLAYAICLRTGQTVKAAGNLPLPWWVPNWLCALGCSDSKYPKERKHELTALAGMNLTTYGDWSWISDTISRTLNVDSMGALTLTAVLTPSCHHENLAPEHIGCTTCQWFSGMKFDRDTPSDEDELLLLGGFRWLGNPVFVITRCPELDGCVPSFRLRSVFECAIWLPTLGSSEAERQHDGAAAHGRFWERWVATARTTIRIV